MDDKYRSREWDRGLQYELKDRERKKIEDYVQSELQKGNFFIDENEFRARLVKGLFQGRTEEFCSQVSKDDEGFRKLELEVMASFIDPSNPKKLMTKVVRIELLIDFFLRQGNKGEEFPAYLGKVEIVK